jgi:uncharacterized NAD(P)/FAD-binding protein YdhS
LSSRTIVVIGAGFSGTVVTARLLAGAGGDPLRVVLINRSGRMARGVAYGTRTEAHVLNVPAGRMSAFPEDENDFLRYARERMPGVLGASFVPRRIYGEYLEAILGRAEAAAGPSVELRRLVGEVTSLEPRSEQGGFALALADGTTLTADRVVLALGNYPPRDPSGAERAFLEGPRYVRDPWAPGALSGLPNGGPILLLGTGLTMLDVVLDLAEGGSGAPIHAVSRRGLLPQAHRSGGAHPSADQQPPGMGSCAPTAKNYLRAVRAQVRRLAAEGMDWRDVIGALRSSTPALWRRLPAAERRRFLRHVRVYWEVHRHRCAPELNARLQALLDEGRLRVHSARIVQLREAGALVAVRIRRRGSALEETLQVSHVVNCTGPETDLALLQDRLLESLRRGGLLRTDGLGLGLDTAPDYALLDSAGTPIPGLYYVGPLLRAQHWEATAVPELRVHAAKLAEQLLRPLA